MEEEFLVI
jgi:hypothetical protein